MGLLYLYLVLGGYIPSEITNFIISTGFSEAAIFPMSNVIDHLRRSGFSFGKDKEYILHDHFSTSYATSQPCELQFFFFAAVNKHKTNNVNNITHKVH